MASLRLRNLSVEFSIYQGGSRSLKKMLVATTTQGNLARDAADRINVRALDDVTLDIEDGDRVALIGTEWRRQDNTAARARGHLLSHAGGELFVGPNFRAFGRLIGSQPGGDGPREHHVARDLHEHSSARDAFACG
jgi:hypothetical protein